MSDITVVMLSPGCWADDTDAVAELNARLDLLSPDLPGRWALRDLGARPEAWGGTKNPPACYGAAFNHLPLDDFLRIVGELTWTEPEAFQLFVMTEQDERYQVLSLAELRVRSATATTTTDA
ncbi:hypothetical protein ACFC58_11440 [Kitasatospora purpeofusca]|uniref:hypothetical protein n=1 Tax=Kitasatospora purpeofusca TaxID=67352 RepID=UPI0035DC4692